MKIDDITSLKLKNHGNTIENELFWLGSRGWEKYATDAWKNLSRHSSVIFDVGANTGLYSLISAKVNSKSDVYAFEPIELIFKRFEKNLKLNQLSVNAYRLALAEENELGKIFVADTISNTFDQASLIPDKYIGANTQTWIIQKRRLSTFIEEHQIKHIDLMKIDVETFEPQVLRGMGHYLKQFAPSILIEILNEKVAHEVETLVKGIGYKYYMIDEKTGYIPKEDLRPTKKGNNFLLLNNAKHNNFKIV